LESFEAARAIFSTANPLDVVDELTIDGGSLALWALPPNIIASRQDAEHAAT
jgi:hypothetical protein